MIKISVHASSKSSQKHRSSSVTKVETNILAKHMQETKFFSSFFDQT